MTDRHIDSRVNPHPTPTPYYLTLPLGLTQLAQ